MRVSIIVAVSENGVIGRGGAIPWRISEDQRFFKSASLGKPVIMGRKTFESLGKPLPGRANIVVTRDAEYAVPGVEVAEDFDTALVLAKQIAEADGAEEIMVAGGTRIYAEALPVASRVYLTEVHGEVAGDTYFPPWDKDQWHEVSRREGVADPKASHTCSFVVLERTVTD